MNNIKKIREARRLTQAELAEKVNLSLLTISRYENGSREPRTSDLIKLCMALKVTIPELLNGASQQEFTVTIKYAKTLEGVNENMNMNGISVTIADDGFVGISGGKILTSYEDIEEVVRIIKQKLTFGFENKDKARGE